MLKWLTGKKTYAAVASTFIVGGLMAAGVVIPPWVLVLLGSSGLGFLRAGVKRTEKDSQSNTEQATRSVLDVAENLRGLLDKVTGSD